MGGVESLYSFVFWPAFWWHCLKTTYMSHPVWKGLNMRWEASNLKGIYALLMHPFRDATAVSVSQHALLSVCVFSASVCAQPPSAFTQVCMCDSVRTGNFKTSDSRNTSMLMLLANTLKFRFWKTVLEKWYLNIYLVNPQLLNMYYVFAQASV